MNTEPSIFTRIINREIPATIVYEDDVVIAFLTIEPVHHGHTLVVPKTPFVNILDGDEATLKHMMSVAARIAKAIIDAKLGTGVNLIMNNGADAGQEVFHAHAHVIPRMHDDGSFARPTHVLYKEGEASAVGDILKEKIK